MSDPFTRAIVGALKSTIDAHGPISRDDVSSAAKRVSAALREVMKRERDLLLATQPRRSASHHVHRPAMNEGSRGVKGDPGDG
jgi:hypothetical protein